MDLGLNNCARAALPLIGAVALTACSGDREAEAETPVAEAEVSTELPESVVSDNRLEAAANAAAEVASSPRPEVVFVPVPAGGGAQGNQQSAQGQRQIGNSAAPANQVQGNQQRR